MSYSKMTWGVKQSFRAYVEAMEGKIEASDGATLEADGTFTFSAAPDGNLAIADDGSVTGSIRFVGSVAFEAHGGMLKSTLSELGIEAGSDGIVLTVADAYEPTERCAIATLSLAEGSEGTTFEAAITMDGMYQIADNYPPGTLLDPVVLA